MFKQYFFQKSSIKIFIINRSSFKKYIIEFFNGYDKFVIMNKEKELRFLETRHNEKDAPLLTRREKEILILIADGLTNNEIATKLFLSPHTIDSHRKNLFIKLDVNNVALLVKKASQLGLL